MMASAPLKTPIVASSQQDAFSPPDLFVNFVPFCAIPFFKRKRSGIFYNKETKFTKIFPTPKEA
jgi:hypothetical protein